MITSKWYFGGSEIAVPLCLREKIFLNNTNFVAAKEDEYDAVAMHVVFDWDNQPVATGRIFHDGSRFFIDSIGVLKEYRKRYVGDLLTRLLIYKTCQYASEIYLKTTSELIPFFSRYGFKIANEESGAITVMKVAKTEIVFPSQCGEHDMSNIIS